METAGTIDLSPRDATSNSLDLAKRRDRWSSALFLSVVMGSLLAVAAVFTDLLSWFTAKPKEPEGTILIVTTLVMLVIAAHCLDKMREADREIRQQQHQQ